MFIEMGRSTWRTPAGAMSGTRIARRSTLHIAPPLGCGPHGPPLYKHCTPLGCDSHEPRPYKHCAPLGRGSHEPRPYKHCIAP